MEGKTLTKEDLIIRDAKRMGKQVIDLSFVQAAVNVTLLPVEAVVELLEDEGFIVRWFELEDEDAA